ncbi:ABC transporter ATP-binding protein [bacterium]|nr:ABC transporter ATP-binding protein [bacterium]
MHAIITNALTKQYGDLLAVDGISFAVEAGEVFGFLGPNGAGKTTTIKMLTGQLLPTIGSATVADFDIRTQRQQLKSQIGVVFEYQNLYERLSAKDNLNFSRRLYGVAPHRVTDVLELVGLGGRANERLMNYSNGMKQRLLIARGLLHDPAILFMDEPTRGLDPGMAADIRRLITELSQSGRTLFLTTHDMIEADRLCDRVAILNRGRIIALDTPERLKQQYGSSLEEVFLNLTDRDQQRARA